DGGRRQVLAQRESLLPTQVGAEVATTGFVTHEHLVATSPAIDETVQQGLATAGDAVAVGGDALVAVVPDHGSDAEVGIPIHIGRVFVADADLPLRQGQAVLHLAAGRTSFGNRA